MSQDQRRLSVSREFWRRLCTEADRRDMRPAQIVELACADVSTVDAEDVRAAMVRARHQTRGGCERTIDIDEQVVDRLDRIAHARSARRGRAVTPGDVLDAAINDFLDAQHWPRAGGSR